MSREYVAVMTEEYLLCVLYRDPQNDRWVRSRKYDLTVTCVEGDSGRRCSWGQHLG